MRTADWLKRVAYFITGDSVIGTSAQLAIWTLFFAALYAAEYFGWNRNQTASIGAGMVTYVCLLLFSPRVREYLQQQDFVGEWKYSNEPIVVSASSKHDQAEDTVRVVKIDRDGRSLRFRGWLDSFSSGNLFFFALRTYVTNFGGKSGELFYWYESPEDAPEERSYYGLVVLQWHKDKPHGKVTQMSGRYYGRSSDSVGSVSYVRLS